MGSIRLTPAEAETGRQRRLKDASGDNILLYEEAGIVNAKPPNRRKRLQISEFPIRSSFSLTVNKCQGLTLPSGVVDLSEQFQGPQGYVALSRFAKPEDVIITKMDFGRCFMNEEVRKELEHLK